MGTTFSTGGHKEKIVSLERQKTGVTVEVKLLKTIFCDGDIPRTLPNFLSYLSSLKTSSESPNSGKIQQENSAHKSALNQSITDDLTYKKTEEIQ